MDNDDELIVLHPGTILQYNDLTRPGGQPIFCREDERQLDPSSGHFSIVKRCNVINSEGMVTGQQVAIKMLKVNAVNRVAASDVDESWQARMSERLKREWTIHRKLKHRYIAPLIGSFEIPERHIWYLVTPWYRNGTVRNFSKKFVAKKFQLLYEAAQGVSYLHSENIVHGDIKSTNVLIDNSGHAVIIDFGVSFVSIPPPEQLQSSNMAEAPQWLAPELHHPNPERIRSYKSDVWAFGCLSLEIYSDRNPFDDVPKGSVSRYLNADDEAERLLPGSPDRYPEVGSNSALWEFCNRCWQHDPENRPSIRDLLNTLHTSQGLTRII